MQHYVCTGDCGGESERSKVCESEGCKNEGQPLSECSCTDGFHKGVLDTDHEIDLAEPMDDEDAL
ncbi:MAG: hypothetical protein A2664_02540 [Candidatus Taylorbacteria bacterium RIFCSPHIGHO2_01_FULL_46_22b]|uniref:Uncharacterized protein n=1 Tax=Candidatus Taylorbacteria bacterium RIFCSPHIGHO2_01_FULL_46_22b TaxID=1802301 RepID=A0A1G2M382_9BACT|nr:MAG: hypothetical protein A2664_02540 [Candidatus Taylorbacteria bacterium RIFCSPHIGHO2_01_FULL_46_22b]